MESWRANLIEDEVDIANIVRALRRIAVLGIKPESRRSEPAFYVPEYLGSRGVEIVPVPVYYPEVERILDRRVVRRLIDVPEAVDLVDVFRRPGDIPGHLDDILAAHPPVVYFQLGIRNDRAAETLARAGIRVIQDRCLKVDYARFVRL